MTQEPESTQVKLNENHSNDSVKSFHDTLESACAHPETFQDRIIPIVEKHPAECIPMLIDIFGSPNTQGKKLVAELFKTRLRETCDKYLIPQLEKANPEKFQWAAQILSEMGNSTAIPLLINSLASRDTTITLSALKALTTFNREDALNAATDFFVRITDSIILASTVKILAANSQEIAPRLLSRYTDLTKDKKAWILKYLVEARSQEAFATFKAALEKDPLDLGLFGIRGLGKIGNLEAVAVLSKAKNHDEWFLRKRIIEALGECRCAEAVPPIIEALMDSSVQVRASAIESLSKVGKMDIFALIKAFENAPHDKKIGLIRAMAQIKAKEFLKPLMKSLSDRSTLFFGIDALGDLGFPEAGPMLQPLLKDEEWFNRMNALEALAKLEVPNLLQIAESCLQDANDMVRNSAARIISKSGD